MRATTKRNIQLIVYQYFEIISTTTTNCGKLWKAQNGCPNCGNVGILQIHKSRAFVARQRENRGVCVEPDALFLELLIEALHGALRRVVVLAEVAKHDVFHARMVDFGHETRRFFIAQMPEWTRDALFQDVRIRAFFQHFHIVVRLNDKVVGTANLLLHHLVKHSNISGDGQCTAFVIKMIAYSTSAIVHDGERLNGDAANLERLQRLYFAEQLRIDFLRRLALRNALQAIRVRVNRDGRQFCQVFKPQHMVDVVVSNQYGLDLAERYVVLCQQIQDLLCTDAHIHQNALVLLAHIIAIAAAARGKTAKNEGRKTGKEIHLIQIWPQK